MDAWGLPSGRGCVTHEVLPLMNEVAAPLPHCVYLHVFLLVLLSPPLPFSSLLPTRPASFPPLFLLGTKGRRERHASGLPSPPGLVATTTTSPFVVVGFFPWKKVDRLLVKRDGEMSIRRLTEAKWTMCGFLQLVVTKSYTKFGHLKLETHLS